MPRQYHDLYNFAVGEVSEDFAERFDLRPIRGALTGTKNWQVTPSAGLAVRPSTAKMVDWATGMWDTGGDLGDVRMFQLLGKNDDYVIRLKGADTGTITVQAFKVSDGSVKNINGAATYTFGSDGTIAFHDSKVKVQATQAGLTLFIVSNLFAPQKITVATGITSDTLTMVPIQFYKELQGTIYFDIATPTKIFGNATQFKNELADGNGPLKYIYFDGEEHAITTVVSDTELTLTTALDQPSFGALNVSSKRASRRWPVYSNSGAAGYIADDGNKVDDDDFITLATSPESSALRPNAVTFYQSRLILAGLYPYEGLSGARFPTRIMASATYDPFVIVAGDDVGADTGGQIAPDAPIEVDIGVNASEQILWALAGRTLVLGTSSGTITANEGELTATGWSHQGGYGSRNGEADTFDGNVVYATLDNKTIRMLEFQRDFDGYRTVPLTPFYDGIASIKRLIVTQPTAYFGLQRIWALNTNGYLSVATVPVGGETIGWTKWDMGENLTILDMVEVSGYIWLAVYRASDENVAMVKILESATDGFALDFRVAQTAASTVSWTTTETYFYSKDVFVCGLYDGVMQPIGWRSVGAGGAFTIPVATTSIVYGIPVEAYFDLVIPPTQDIEGIALGQVQKVTALTFRVIDTRKLKVDGRDLIQGELPLGDQPRRTESRKIVGGSWGTMKRVRVANEQPHTAKIANVLVETMI